MGSFYVFRVHDKHFSVKNSEVFVSCFQVLLLLIQLYILREIMKLISDQHEGRPQSKVFFIISTAGGLSLSPSLHTHPLSLVQCCSLTNHSSSCLISYSNCKAVEIYACFLLLSFILQWQHMHRGS